MLSLTQQKLEEILEGFVASIKTQLKARPLGVEVSEAWILDLARNMAAGLAGYDDNPDGLCKFCGGPFETEHCSNGCIGGYDDNP